MRIRRSAGVVMFALFVLSGARPEDGFAKAAEAAPSGAGRGRATFQETCAVCHGDKGKGNGPAASGLAVHPADLTRLTKAGEPFPAMHVESVLKGTDTTGAHTNIMMLWRALFLADANGNETAAAERVSDLVEFIRSIQVKPARPR